MKMKYDNHDIDKTRFYEVSEIPKRSVWYEKPDSNFCSLGAIVQPVELRGSFTIIKPAPSGFLSASVNRDLHLGIDITLRPLNKKDQAKLQRVRDQYA